MKTFCSDIVPYFRWQVKEFEAFTFERKGKLVFIGSVNSRKHCKTSLGTALL